MRILLEVAIEIRPEYKDMAVERIKLHLMDTVGDGLGWLVNDLQVAEEPTQLRNAAVLLAEACQEFCRKVENGEARSSKSYAQMKEALKTARESGIAITTDAAGNALGS